MTADYVTHARREANRLAIEGRFKQAIDILEPLLERSDDKDICIDLGILYMRAKRNEEGIRLLANVVETHPGYTDGWLTFSTALSLLERWEEARDKVEHAYDLSPERLDVLQACAIILPKVGEPEAALPMALEVTRLEPGDSIAWLHLGNILLDLNEFGAAQHAYERANDIDQGSADENLKVLKRLSRDSSKALKRERKELVRRVKSCPEDNELLLTLAWHTFEYGPSERAEPLVQRVLRRSPDDLNALLMLGKIRFVEGDLREAKHLLEYVLRKRDDQILAYHLLGMIYHDQGRQKKAIEYLKKATELGRERDQPWYLLSVFYAEEGKTSESEHAIRMAISALPTYPYYHYVLGNLLWARSEEKDAEKSFKHAIALDPYLPEAHKSLEALYMAQGRYNEAEFAWLPDLGESVKDLSPSELERFREYQRISEDVLQDHIEMMCPRKSEEQEDHE